jgi:hypothetical protein
MKYALVLAVALWTSKAILVSAADDYTTYEAKCLVEIEGVARLDGPCNYVVGPRIIYLTPQATPFEIKTKFGSGR